MELSGLWVIWDLRYPYRRVCSCPRGQRCLGRVTVYHRHIRELRAVVVDPDVDVTVTTPTGCSHRVWNRRWLNDTPRCTNVYLTFYRKRLRNI